MSVIALAGRRVDADGAVPPRFPLANVPLVEERLGAELRARRAEALVSSAACGADLIALRAAQVLGIDRRVVLPFDAARFRRTSVSDRPGGWGPLFDQVIEQLGASGDLVVLDETRADSGAYAAVNLRILDEARWLGAARQADVLAVLVWDGAARGDDDLTAAFGQAAAGRGIRLVEILTLTTNR